MKFFQKFFGNNENDKQKNNATQARRLRFEPLESREMLSISVAEFPSVQATCSDLNLSANTGHYIFSEEGAPVLTLLSTPTNFHCTPKTPEAGSDTGSMSLTWSPVADATGYEVQCRKTGTTAWSTVNVTITGTSAVVSNLVAGMQYDIRLRATNDSDNYSAWATPEILSTPTNFRTDGKKACSISLTWSSVKDATGYEIQWRKAGYAEWSSINKNVTFTGTSAIVSGLAANTLYEFQLRATNCSSYSNSKWTTPPLSERTLLSSPTFCSTTWTDHFISLAWTSKDCGIDYATGYEVQWRKSGTDTWSTTNVTIVGPSAVVTNLSANTQYDVRLRSKNDNYNNYSYPFTPPTFSAA
ncbi:MAG: fibronectin type III domain-containing protein [Planctomycetaceae bacterium]|nr:fibronectin type III domain-containing protein [Planctomycetaceae bacterium]